MPPATLPFEESKKAAALAVPFYLYLPFEGR